MLLSPTLHRTVPYSPPISCWGLKHRSPAMLPSLMPSAFQNGRLGRFSWGWFGICLALMETCRSYIWLKEKIAVTFLPNQEYGCFRCVCFPVIGLGKWPLFYFLGTWGPFLDFYVSKEGARNGFRRSEISSLKLERVFSVILSTAWAKLKTQRFIGKLSPFSQNFEKCLEWTGGVKWSQCEQKMCNSCCWDYNFTINRETESGSRTKKHVVVPPLKGSRKVAS